VNRRPNNTPIHTPRSGTSRPSLIFLRSLLRPLASERGLNSFDELASYAMSEWYLEKLTFGKFKGRHFQDVRHDKDLKKMA
jgi:hypothetical protein